jgi:hypothetical protein
VREIPVPADLITVCSGEFSIALPVAFGRPQRCGAVQDKRLEVGEGARTSSAPVWFSTYTKNLQGRIDQEIQRIIADRPRQVERAKFTVIVVRHNIRLA